MGDFARLRTSLTVPTAQAYALLTEPSWATSLAAQSTNYAADSGPQEPPTSPRGLLEFALVLSNRLSGFIVDRLVRHYGVRGSTRREINAQLGAWSPNAQQPHVEDNVSDTISFSVDTAVITIGYNMLRRRLATTVIAPSLLSQGPIQRSGTNATDTTATTTNTTTTTAAVNDEATSDSDNDSTDSEPSCPPPIDFLTFWLLIDGVIDIQPSTPQESPRDDATASSVNPTTSGRRANSMYNKAARSLHFEPFYQSDDIQHSIQMLEQLRDYVLHFVYSIPSDVPLDTIFDSGDVTVNLSASSMVRVPKTILIEALKDANDHITDVDVLPAQNSHPANAMQWSQLRQMLLNDAEVADCTTLSQLGFSVYQFVSFAGSPIVQNAAILEPPAADNAAGHSERPRHSIVDGRLVVGHLDLFPLQNAGAPGLAETDLQTVSVSSASSTSSESHRSTVSAHTHTPATPEDLIERAGQLLQESFATERNVESNGKPISPTQQLRLTAHALNGAQRSAEKALSAAEQLSHQLKALEHKKQELSVRINDLERRVEDLYEAEATESRKNLTLEGTLKTREAYIRRLEETSSSIIAEKGALISKISSLESELAQRLRERASPHDSAQAGTSPVTLRSDSCTMNDKVEALENTNKALQQQLLTLQSQLTSAITELRTTKEAMAAAYQAERESTEQCSALNQRLRDLEQERKTLMFKSLTESGPSLLRESPERQDTSLHHELESIKHFRTLSFGSSAASVLSRKLTTTWSEESQLSWTILETEFKIVKNDILRDDKPVTAARQFATALLLKFCNSDLLQPETVSKDVITEEHVDIPKVTVTIEMSLQLMHSLLCERLSSGWTLLHLIIALRQPDLLDIFFAKAQSSDVTDDAEKMQVSVSLNASFLFASNGTFDQLSNQYNTSPTSTADSLPLDVVPLAVQCSSNSGLTPLHICAALGSEHTFKLLIANGGNAATSDLRGNTPIHWLGFRKECMRASELRKTLYWASKSLPPLLSIESLCRWSTNVSGFAPQLPHLNTINFQSLRRRLNCQVEETPGPPVTTASTTQVLPDDWDTIETLQDFRCPYVNYLSRNYSSGDVYKEPCVSLVYSSSDEFIQKLAKLPLPELHYDHHQLLHRHQIQTNGASRNTGVSAAFRELRVPEKEIDRGLWVTTVLNYTCNGVAECHIPIATSLSKQNISQLSQILLLTDTRLALIGYPPEHSWGPNIPSQESVLLNVLLEHIKNVAVLDNSDHVCILSISRHGDYLLDISQRNDFLRLLYSYRFEKQKDDGNCSLEKALSSQLIMMHFDKMLYLYDNQERPATLLTFLELESFLLLPYNPESLLIQNSASLVHFGFIGLCANPPGPLVHSVADHLQCTGDLVKSAQVSTASTTGTPANGITGPVYWKEFFVLLHINGSLSFCIHPNDILCVFSFNVSLIRQIRMFNFSLTNSSKVQSNSGAPCQPLLALDFAPSCRPSTVILHPSSEIDRGRWKEALDFVIHRCSLADNCRVV